MLDSATIVPAAEVGVATGVVLAEDVADEVISKLMFGEFLARLFFLTGPGSSSGSSSLRFHEGCRLRVKYGRELLFRVMTGELRGRGLILEDEYFRD